MHLREGDELPTARPVGRPVFHRGPFPAFHRRRGQSSSGWGAGVGWIRPDCVPGEEFGDERCESTGCMDVKIVYAVASPTSSYETTPQYFHNNIKLHKYLFSI